MPLLSASLCTGCAVSRTRTTTHHEDENEDEDEDADTERAGTPFAVAPSALRPAGERPVCRHRHVGKKRDVAGPREDLERRRTALLADAHVASGPGVGVELGMDADATE